MSTSNEKLLKRAEITISDLSSNGGLLLPEQSNRFIDYIVDQPTILRQARVVRMNGPTHRIERVGFDARIARAAVQTVGSRPLGASDHTKPTTSKIELATKEVMAEVRLPYEVLEDNIERGNFEDHVMRLIAQRFTQDLEELALNGDTASGDTYLALTDGYLKQMTSNVVDNLSAGIDPDMFDNGLLAMPQRYLRNVNGLKHFVSVANHIKYRQNVAQRQTGYGDSALTQDIQLFAAGVPIEASPMLAAAGETAFGAADGAAANTGFTTFADNMLFGIQRDIYVETDRIIANRELQIVVTARVDFLLDEEEACVKYVNI